ncbi:selenoneine synthase SenA [Anaeromyxobacter oryzae]|uniref:Hercynine oxygenase n=1 Tax=Anaeromyxobacter oryzae TaxID=2918170 RepID=A0ABM7WPC4_9BACT|nr:selenoneine synthase SenA [Anaeromyxobacter oryzae]BDG01315.1 hercynine oxygenase [Anaeromyxobacter oryzae]
MDDAVGAWIRDARARTLALGRALAPGALLGPRLAIVNPPLWELGHVAWFQERWILRRAGLPPLRADGDALYDSIAIPHDRRWELPLPSLASTLEYLAAVEAAALARLAAASDPADAWFACLTVFHEDMHLEAMAFTRQTLGDRAPPLPGTAPAPEGGGPCPGDVAVPGGTFLLGASPDEPFVFDNEKWAHPVALAPFRIARAPVTQADFGAFVDDGGYARRALWSDAGWRWREAAGVDRPAYWERAGDRWARREFDRVVPLAPHRPMVHVNWWEAEAWCRWAGRRLPTEAEWEAAAAGEPGPDGRLAAHKRRFPWGDAPPTPERAHLDARVLHPVDVGALAAGDSAFGCRQLVGNVWEWTASDFLPYPGFVPDPYREYSQPWFGTHRVLRGGSFATPARLLRNTWRNFYTPDRRDMWVGFRTCAV